MNRLAKAESLDQGKSINQALNVEIPRCVTNLRYYSDLILNYNQYVTEMETPIACQNVIRNEPLGVVVVISPWNLPLYLLTWKIAPALAMGNCVIAKPSELTSLTAFKLAELLTTAGFPPGVLNILFGRGSTVGNSLVSQPTVKAISFTGGTVTGQKIANAAASSVPFGKKVSLELGGKNPSIVFADCDFENTIQDSIKAAFSNQGEICLCMSRVYVEKSIYERFVTKFVELAKAIKVGNPLDVATEMGAIVSKEHLQKILSFIDLARRENDTILLDGSSFNASGENKDGYFVGPTVITNVQQSSRLIQEEIFGPVVCILPFDGEEEAINFANNSAYGLAASVWTVDGRKAQRVARKIKSGVVWINCWMIRDLATPFGGVKSSGYGREGGTFALEFFSDIKTITTTI